MRCVTYVRIPTQHNSEGPFSRSLIFISNGSPGAISRAASATSTTSAMTALPISAERLRTKRPSAFLRRGASRSLEADAGVEVRIRDIDQQVGHREDERYKYDGALHHRVIALVDGDDRQATTPGQPKIVSVTTAPPSSPPICKPMTVTTGSRAFFI
jgi:hypothetical protein